MQRQVEGAAELLPHEVSFINDLVAATWTSTTDLQKKIVSASAHIADKQHLKSRQRSPDVPFVLPSGAAVELTRAPAVMTSIFTYTGRLLTHRCETNLTSCFPSAVPAKACLLTVDS